MHENAGDDKDRMAREQDRATDLSLNGLRFGHSQLGSIIDLALQIAYILSVLLLVPHNRLASPAEQQTCLAFTRTCSC